MVFSSALFLFLFLPALLVLHQVLPGPLRNALLLAASVLFYAWGEPVFVWALLISLICNYWIARLMDQSHDDRQRLGCATVLVVFNLFLLGYFKYAGFFAGILARFTGLDISWAKFPPLPIGISFFTFQVMSYGIDVYRREQPAQKKFVPMALYLLFFPQLIAGPIVRYRDIAPQLGRRRVDWEGFSYGLQRFIVGLAKKAVIANGLAAAVDKIFAVPGHSLTAALAWQGALGYTLQIYFDFSGYSDMAIGLGRMFGFCFRENFNKPYQSVSVTDFWRRWHISLSSWFRDYLYLPLGGNRHGTARTVRNLLLVFFLCGLWHGAKWAFVFWGLYHGLFLLLERACRGRWKVPSILGWAYTLLVVMVGWIFFRAGSLPKAFAYLKAMLGQGIAWEAYPHLYFDSEQWVLAACGIFFAVRSMKPLAGKPLEALALLALFFYSVVLISAGTYNPFIYYQF